MLKCLWPHCDRDPDGQRALGWPGLCQPSGARRPRASPSHSLSAGSRPSAPAMVTIAQAACCLGTMGTRTPAPSLVRVSARPAPHTHGATGSGRQLRVVTKAPLEGTGELRTAGELSGGGGPADREK